MLDTTKLLLFLPTIIAISATPGMCMTLAMTLGMTVGLRRTAWMMIGEIAGVGLVVVLCGAGISQLVLSFPAAFMVFKILGGAYIGWLGIQLWRSRGALSLSLAKLAPSEPPQRRTLVVQGFVTAIANPKGWAFFMTLLPPFLVPSAGPANAQLLAIVAIVALSELLCMTLYATGGRSLARRLGRRGNVALINRLAGTLMLGVGIWLIAG